MSMNNAERWLVKEKSLINHLFFSKLTEMFLRRPRLLIIVDKLL